jgi:hypothetical protein
LKSPDTFIAVGRGRW